MRYFQTSNASRRYVAGSLAFVFEPVSNQSGSWLGVLAVEDAAAAKTLADAKIPQIAEIGLEEFENLKKKPQPQSLHFRVSPPAVPPSVPQFPVVAAAAKPASTPSKPEIAAVPTELTTAILDVPDELKFEGASGKAVRRGK